MPQQMKPLQAPHRAEKKRKKLKLGVQGPSGSGKTKGALTLVKSMWPGAKVLLCDSENLSSELYADEFEFDVQPMDPPFESRRFEACIDRAVREKYDVLILDTISHQWEGEGGILLRKDEMDRRPGVQNSYMNWNSFTPEHTHFLECIKQAPIHIICTMRSKQDYAIDNSSGKAKPIKIGLAPIVRENTEYEFDIVFDIQMDHRCTLSKNRTGLFEGEVINLFNPEVGQVLKDWLEKGREVEQPKEWSTASVKSSAAAGVAQDKAAARPGNANAGHGNEGPYPGGNGTASTTTAPKKEYKPPLIEEYPVEQTIGRGKSKRTVEVKWYELSGYVIGVRQFDKDSAPVEAGSSTEVKKTVLGIHGMPETNKVPGERHRRFENFHKTLHPILATAHAGSTITLRYFPEVAGDKSHKAGELVQTIEEVIEVDGQRYDEDGNKIDAAAEAEKEAAQSAPVGESASPEHLFND